MFRELKSRVFKNRLALIICLFVIGILFFAMTMFNRDFNRFLSISYYNPAYNGNNQNSMLNPYGTGNENNAYNPYGDNQNNRYDLF